MIKAIINFIDKIIRWGLKKKITPFLMGLFIIGLPCYLLVIIYFIVRKNSIIAKPDEIFFIYIAVNWIWIGFVSIWYYNKSLIKNFITNIQSILKQKDSYKSIIGIPSIYSNILVIIWVLTVGIVYLLSKDYMINKLGFIGFADPLYLISIFGIIIIAFLTGLGFSGVINTFILILNVHKHCDLVIDPYNIDELGGLSVFGNLTIKTTMLFSTGALFVPILITITKELNPMFSIGIYVLVGFFSLFILLSFIAPNYLINKKAQKEIEKDLKELNIKLTDLSQKILYKTSDIQVLLLYNNLRNYFKDLKSTNLFPFNPRIILGLVSSVILPVAMIVTEIIISKFLG